MAQVTRESPYPNPPAAAVEALADDPPIAAMEDGGSYAMGPTVTVEPKDYSYEACRPSRRPKVADEVRWSAGPSSRMAPSTALVQTSQRTW